MPLGKPETMTNPWATSVFSVTDGWCCLCLDKRGVLYQLVQTSQDYLARVMLYLVLLLEEFGYHGQLHRSICLHGQPSLKASDPEIGMDFSGQTYSTFHCSLFLEKKYILHGSRWGRTQKPICHNSWLLCHVYPFPAAFAMDLCYNQP